MRQRHCQCASVCFFPLSCKSLFSIFMTLFCTCDFFHNVKFMANKHKSFFLLTVKLSASLFHFWDIVSVFPLMWLFRFSREKQLPPSVGCVLITACFTYLGSFGVNAAARESWGISGSISCVQLLFCGGGTEIILSVPLAPKLPAQEQATHSQILSLSLSSHLGNGNLYLQTVGAGGEHEILKSTSRYSPPPSPLGLPPLSLPTPPSHTFHQRNALGSGSPLVEAPSCFFRVLVCNSSNIPLVSCVPPALFTVYIPRPDTTPDRWHKVEKHQFVWILTLMHSQTKYNHSLGRGRGGAWKINKHLSGCPQYVLRCWNNLCLRYFEITQSQDDLSQACLRNRKGGKNSLTPRGETWELCVQEAPSAALCDPAAPPHINQGRKLNFLSARKPVLSSTPASPSQNISPMAQPFNTVNPLGALNLCSAWLNRLETRILCGQSMCGRVW